MGDIVLRNGLRIPQTALSWRYETSGGPGGQHANRSSTVAIVSLDIGNSTVFDDGVRSLLLERLGSRAPGGVVTVGDGTSRSQWTNRQRARKKLTAVLDDALRPERRRRPTSPPAGARRRRLSAKRRRSDVKRLRRQPDTED